MKNMTVNEKLEEAVLNMMAKQLIEEDESFKIVADGEVETARDIISQMGKAYVDYEEKFRYHFSKFIGYGYDFSKEDAEETYNRAVKNTRERLLGDMGETLLFDEIDKSKNIGLYLTKI